MTTTRPTALGQAADAELGAPGGLSVGASVAGGRRRSNLVLAGAGFVLVAGIVLRFWVVSELWLDETLSVNIARVPLRMLPDALRHDGAPPLYYVLLHGWMRVFGEGNLAVRSLSGVLGVAALPVAWLAARRLGGRDLATAAVLLVASSPFAVRYATETRMYSLVILLSLLGVVALSRALEKPTPARLVPVGLLTAALLLTHYWSIYLLAVTGAMLVWRTRAAGVGRGPHRCLYAMAAGSLLFLPWLPVFAFQLANTGTPWAGKPAPAAVVEVIRHFAGAHTDAGAFLSLLYPGLHALAVFGRPRGPRRVELNLVNRGPAVMLAVVSLGTVVLGVAVSRLTGGAFIARYASVAVGPFLLLAAVGTVAFPAGRVRDGVLASAVILGLTVGIVDVDSSRTQSGDIARALPRYGRPGDVVIYCPDQLGPAASRVVPAGFDQLTYPTGGRPERVDWVDYERRNRAAEPGLFAQRVLDRAGPGRQIFVVWAPGYRTFGRSCEEMLVTLRRARTSVERVRASARNFERMALVQFLPQ